MVSETATEIRKGGIENFSFLMEFFNSDCRVVGKQIAGGGQTGWLERTPALE